VIRDEQPVATSLTAKEIHARSLHLDRLSIMGEALDLPGSAGQRHIPGFEAVARLGSHLAGRLILLEGLPDRGVPGDGLAGLRHERGVPLVVIEQDLDVAGVERLGIAAVEVLGRVTFMVPPVVARVLKPRSFGQVVRPSVSMRRCRTAMTATPAILTEQPEFRGDRDVWIGAPRIGGA
jgi:hypothetical protein